MEPGTVYSAEEGGAVFLDAVRAELERNAPCFVAIGTGNPDAFVDAVAELCPIVRDEGLVGALIVNGTPDEWKPLLPNAGVSATLLVAATLKKRPDGWPLCPVCGEDELGDLEHALADANGRLFCYRCGRHTVENGAPIPSAEAA